MKHGRYRSQKGITLIEMIIVIGLIAVVALFAYMFIFQGFTLFNNQNAEIEDQVSVRVAMSHITNNLRDTLPENVSVAGNSLIVDGVAYTFNDSSLFFGDGEIATDISEFTVVLNGAVIELHILSEAGKQIDTSYTLRQ